MWKKIFVVALGLTLLMGLSAYAFAEGKQFEDVTIVFFPGGNEGCPFASVVYRGAKAAENDLGCKVDYVWSDWLPDKMVAQFKEAIARRPDGIAIMGHPGVAAFAPLVDEARQKGSSSPARIPHCPT